MSNKSHRRKKSNGSSKSSKSESGISSFLDDISDDNNFNGPKYEVKRSKTVGRYIVATKDIKPGEKIISELPLVVGPCTNCKVQCLGCYKDLERETKLYRCPNCMWPMCSSKCPGINQQYGHTKIECTILQECKSAKRFNFNNYKELRNNYQAIVPLRCLILKTIDPTNYGILMDMESHNEIRKHIPDLWKVNQIRVVDKIIKEWGLTEFTENEIHTICGILEVNAFEIGQLGINLRALYPTAFLLSHDCVPNTNHIDQIDNYQLTIRASTRILDGQPITMSYAYTLQSTYKRREHLLENKFFECHCKRCSDPTELGTYLGALICPKCDNGLVLCDNPLDFDSSWSCISSRKSCPGYSITAQSVRLLIERISNELDQIDNNDLEGLEDFLFRYRNVLHSTHYLCLNVKISLSQLYGRINGYLVHELSEKLLVRKREICREILKVFNIIEPGFTRIRGVTLYEIHAPMMIFLTRQMETQSLAKSDIKLALKRILKYLIEAKVILCHEPELSSEGIIGQAVNEALIRIKDWEKIVGKIR